MKLTIAAVDLISNTCFPALAADELGFFKAEGLDVRIELAAMLGESTVCAPTRRRRSCGAADDAVTQPALANQLPKGGGSSRLLIRREPLR